MKASTLVSLILFLFAAATDHAPRAQAPTREPEQTGAAPGGRSTVRGRVVYSDSGNPARRIEVVLLDAATNVFLLGATTDVKGEFAIGNVAAGFYRLSAHGPGLVNPEALYQPERGADALDLPEGMSGQVEVEVDGKADAEVTIRARRGGAITGRVTADDGEPVAEAQVRLFRLWRGRLVRVPTTWDPPKDEAKYMKTDSRGVYRVGGLPAGEYVVRASESDLGGGSEGEADAYADGTLVVSYFPSATAFKDAAVVKVYEGRDTSGVDIRLPDRPVRKLSGTVTLKNGDPLYGVEITVDRKDEGAYSRSGLAEKSAVTDTEGRWEVLGVPDGEYVLTASAIFTLYMAARNRDVNIVPVKREINVSGADITDLRLEVEEGVHVSGTVKFEGGSGEVYLLVEALRNGERADFTFTRSDGKFALDTVPAGEIRLRVLDFPPDRFYVKSVTWNQVDLLREPLRIGERTRVEGVRVVLSADVARLDGQALARRDSPAPLARALVALVSADEKLRRGGARPLVVRADPRGRFKLSAAPGEYLIVALPESAARRPGLKLDEEFVRRAQPTLTRVTLRAGTPARGVKVFGVEQ